MTEDSPSSDFKLPSCLLFSWLLMNMIMLPYSILKCAVQKPDGWIVKLFSMLISSKHTGTGSFNKNKKNLRKKKKSFMGVSVVAIVFFEWKLRWRRTSNKTMQCDRLKLILPTDHQQSLNQVRSVYLESIEQLHYRRYKRPIAIDESDDDPLPDLLCSSLHKGAGLGFTAV